MATVLVIMLITQATVCEALLVWANARQASKVVAKREKKAGRYYDDN